MTELLPVIFQRGQNESIDPRVAPTEMHTVAQNVRWRKDGRPAKRYGSASVPTTGFEQSSSQYLTQPANAICSWQSQPLFLCGGGAASGNGTVWGQRLPSSPTFTASGLAVDISHWGPGSRSTLANPEGYQLANASIGFGNGCMLAAWDSGGSGIVVTLRSRDGAVLVQPYQMDFGSSPRCISVSNGGVYIYVLYKLGTALTVACFNTSTFVVTTQVLDTLGSAGYYFDAVGRGTDLVVTYQFTATTAKVRTYTPSGSSLTATASQTYTISSSVAAKVGIGATATSNIFAGYTQDAASGGRVQFIIYNNALSAVVTALALANIDVNNLDPPGFLVDSNTTAVLTWGGVSSVAPAYGYLCWANISSSGTGTVTTVCGIRPASKPFSGPAQSTLGWPDAGYLWVHTAQYAGSTLWDDQRGYLMVQLTTGPLAVGLLRRQMHIPNIAASAGPNEVHLADVVNNGTGYGYATALVSTIRYGGGATEAYGAELITFRSIYESQRQAARDFAPAGRVVQFSGGSLSEWNGSIEETGFSSTPVIITAPLSAGGALSAGTYVYKVVFEYIDAQGRRHRSTPSDPFTLTAAAGQKATLNILRQAAESRLWSISGVSALVHVYRTLVGQSTFYRISPNIGASGAGPGGSLASFVDTVSDVTALARGEILYTDGGVVPNTLAPPSTFMCVCNGRLWLGGQLDRNVITASKLLVEGEPTQFSDEFEFSVFLPTECTGLASIDGTVVAFARERIYFVTGDGPSDQGIGSFSPPTELPTDVGCIDWRSIVECSQGIFFQSKRGIYLLPRGFNTPVFVGAEVETTLAAYPIVQSATLVSQPSTSSDFLGEITVRFVVATDETGSSTRALVYDMRTGGWSVDSFNGIAAGIGGTWLDTFVFSTQSSGVFSTLRSETVGSYDDLGAPSVSLFIPTTLSTGDIRPFGVAGYGDFNSVVLLGEYRGNAFVDVSVSVDGQTADVYRFTVTAADAVDGSVYLDVTPKIRKGSAIRVGVADSGITPLSPTEGFVMQALFIEHETIGKTKRLATARRA